MDNGRPFRVPQGADRRGASRPQAAPQRVEEPYVNEEPASVQAAPVRGGAKKPRGKMIATIIALLVVLGLLAGGWYVWSNSKTKELGIESGKYQMVWLINGQYYFGKLKSLNDNYLSLTDVYYILPKDKPADAETPQDVPAEQSASSLELIKLGNEVHGPEDEMIIPREQMMFFENLKDNGKVVQAIKQEKATK